MWLLNITATLTLLAAVHLHFSTPVEVTFPNVGRVVVAPEQHGESADLVFKGPNGHVVHRENFDILRYEGAEGIAFRVIKKPGVPQPLLIAIAHQVGADGVNTQVAIVASVGGRLRNVWPRPAFRFSEDGLCIGNLGPAYGAGVAEFRRIDGSDCVLCSHRYTATVSTWSGDHFVTKAVLRTTKKYEEAPAAARELGFACRDLITSTVLHKP